MRDEDADLMAFARNLLAEEERPETEAAELVRAADAVRSSPLWSRARRARRRLVEVPFAAEVPRERVGRDEGPERVVLSGAIDLAFEEEDGWVLVDYKSDTLTPANRDALIAFYREQVLTYRRQWQDLTGRPTRAGLFFVHAGETVWLDD